MTPKDKAKFLYGKIMFNFGEYYKLPEAKSMAKKCALNIVNEILDYIEESGSYIDNLNKEYWLEVKQEIENI